MGKKAGGGSNLVLSLGAVVGLLMGLGGWFAASTAETVLQEQAGFSLMIVGAILFVGGILGNLVHEVGNAILLQLQAPATPQPPVPSSPPPPSPPQPWVEALPTPNDPKGWGNQAPSKPVQSRK